MSEIVAFLLLGVGSGALISGVGMGVVLSYRGAGVINLAVGAIAMIAGFFFWFIRSGEFGFIVALVPAVVATLLFAAGLGVLFELSVVRPQRNATPLAKLIATLGALLFLQASMIVAFGPAPRPQPSILPSQNLRVMGQPVALHNFIIAGVLLVAAALLVAVYRWTRFGLATRAAAENEVHAMFLGLSPNRLSLVSTVLMSVLMGIVGVLAGSVTQLDSQTLPLLIVPGLTAATFARFTSFGTTFVVGILIGMGESLLLYASTQPWFPTTAGPGSPLPGVQQLLIFLLLVVAMFVRASRIPGRGDVLERRLPTAPKPKHPLRSALVFGALGAVALPVLPGGYRGALIISFVSAILLLSIVIVTGFLGQVSVGQLALGGVAGFVVSHLATDADIGFPWAPVAGILFATLLGFLCGIPALRVRGVTLAVVTLAAAVAIEEFGFANTMWGGGVTGSTVPPPTVFGYDFGPNGPFHGFFGAAPSPLFGWVVLAVLVLLGLFVSNLRRSGFGQDMLAVRANERAAAAAGVDIRSTKLLGFTLSAAVAGAGGTLLAYTYGSITADSYDTITALSLIAFAYISGITTVSGAVWGGLIFIGSISAYAMEQWFGIQGEWFMLVGGILLVATLVHRPEGVATAIFYGRAPEPRRRAREAGPDAVGAAKVPS
jgi:branched-chain amino acid transport system permease protein